MRVPTRASGSSDPYKGVFSSVIKAKPATGMAKKHEGRKGQQGFLDSYMYSDVSTHSSFNRAILCLCFSSAFWKRENSRTIVKNMGYA